MFKDGYQIEILYKNFFSFFSLTKLNCSGGIDITINDFKIELKFMIYNYHLLNNRVMFKLNQLMNADYCILNLLLKNKLKIIVLDKSQLKRLLILNYSIDKRNRIYIPLIKIIQMEKYSLNLFELINKICEN